MERHDLRNISWTRVFDLIGEPNKQKCWKIYQEHQHVMEHARGSKTKHQAWDGGYIDHICETVGIAEAMYEAMSRLRPLEFSLSEAALVLFIHDLEKPFKHQEVDGKIIDNPSLATMESRKEFVLKMCADYGINLTDAQKAAYKYIEGEGNDYHPYHRVQNPLGAFCHCCDVFSARIWFNYPKVS